MVSTKKLFIFVAGLVLLAGLSQWLQNRSQHAREGRVGKPLLPLEAVNQLDQVIITKGALQLHIKLVEGVWRLQEKENFPAKGQQLLDFVGLLASIKPADLISEDEARLKDFNLLVPDGQSEGAFGIQVQLLAGQEQVLDLVLGDDRPSQGGTAGGRYIRVQGEPQVYLIKEEINLPYMPEDWMQTSLLSLPEAEVLGIQVTAGKKELHVQRTAGTEDFTTAAGKAISLGKLRGLLTELGNLTLMDAIPREAAAKLNLQQVALVTITLADGGKIGFQLFTEDLHDERNHFLQFAAANEAAAKRFHRQLELGKTWVFELQEWQITKWTQAPDQLQAANP